MAFRAQNLAFLAVAACACGPLSATSVILDAEAAVARAHAAGGEQSAIYEMTSADLYLRKAQEEQSAAHYGAAIDLARESAAFAAEAVKKSGARRKVEEKK